MFYLFGLLLCGSSVLAVFAAIAAKHVKPLPGTIRIVQEILCLIESDPEGWTVFSANEENGIRYYPYWMYKKERVVVTLKFNFEIDQVWEPVRLQLTQLEKRKLKDAFHNLAANRIAKASSKALLLE